MAKQGSIAARGTAVAPGTDPDQLRWIASTRALATALDLLHAQEQGVSFKVTVEDTTPPALSGVPDNLTLEALSAAGAPFVYRSNNWSMGPAGDLTPASATLAATTATARPPTRRERHPSAVAGTVLGRRKPGRWSSFCYLCALHLAGGRSSSHGRSNDQWITF